MLRDYVMALAKHHPFTRNVKVDQRRVIPKIAAFWPKIPEGTAQAQELWGYIDDIVQSFPVLETTPKFLLRISVAASRLAPLAVPEPEEAVSIAAFDGITGIMHRCFVPAVEKLPSLDDMAIPTGLLILCQSLPPLINPLHDNYPLNLKAQGTNYPPVFSSRNRDKIVREGDPEEKKFISRPSAEEQKEQQRKTFENTRATYERIKKVAEENLELEAVAGEAEHETPEPHEVHEVEHEAPEQHETYEIEHEVPEPHEAREAEREAPKPRETEAREIEHETPERYEALETRHESVEPREAREAERETPEPYEPPESKHEGHEQHETTEQKREVPELREVYEVEHEVTGPHEVRVIEWETRERHEALEARRETPELHEAHEVEREVSEPRETEQETSEQHETREAKHENPEPHEVLEARHETPESREAPEQHETLGAGREAPEQREILEAKRKTPEPYEARETKREIPERREAPEPYEAPEQRETLEVKLESPAPHETLEKKRENLRPREAEAHEAERETPKPHEARAVPSAMKQRDEPITSPVEARLHKIEPTPEQVLESQIHKAAFEETKPSLAYQATLKHLAPDQEAAFTKSWEAPHYEISAHFAYGGEKQPPIIRFEPESNMTPRLIEAKYVVPHVSPPHNADVPANLHDIVEPMAERYRHHEFEVEQEARLEVPKNLHDPDSFAQKYRRDQFEAEQKQKLVAENQASQPTLQMREALQQKLQYLHAKAKRHIKLLFESRFDV